MPCILFWTVVTYVQIHQAAPLRLVNFTEYKLDHNFLHGMLKYLFDSSITKNLVLTNIGKSAQNSVIN